VFTKSIMYAAVELSPARAHDTCIIVAVYGSWLDFTPQDDSPTFRPQINPVSQLILENATSRVFGSPEVRQAKGFLERQQRVAQVLSQQQQEKRASQPYVLENA